MSDLTKGTLRAESIIAELQNSVISPIRMLLEYPGSLMQATTASENSLSK